MNCELSGNRMQDLKHKKIARLPESVINQIAAGEVVENPASIIKELIDNSLDAGAKKISLSIRGGGHFAIELEDDGCGMSPEDAALSLERHATSKIRTAEDLFSLSTMGFRGEALAAISSVSVFELKTSDGHIGTWIKCRGGAVEETLPCARNQGTTIFVRSLFFNVPARKKFQKSASSSVAQVTKIVELMSLSRPDVSFSYFSDGEKVLDLPSQSRKDRVESVVGPLEHFAEEPSLWGLFSCPSQAKSHRRGQMVFVNGRPVFSPLISKAVQMGYSTRLKENTYPPFVLFMELDPSSIDVNVHPQKKEIRFSNESECFQNVERFTAGVFISRPSLNFTSSPVFEPPPVFLFKEPEVTYVPQMEQKSFSLEIEEKPLAILGKYCLMEKEGWILVDLVRARSRVMADVLKDEKKQTQALLLPLEIEIDDSTIVNDLEAMGVECRWIGKKKIAVDALPSVLEPSDFPHFIAHWKEGKAIDRASALMCQQANRRYSLEEAIHLWRCLQNCQDSLYDPLGKKIWEKVALKDLESWMSRG